MEKEVSWSCLPLEIGLLGEQLSIIHIARTFRISRTDNTPSQSPDELRARFSALLFCFALSAQKRKAAGGKRASIEDQDRRHRALNLNHQKDKIKKQKLGEC